MPHRLRVGDGRSSLSRRSARRHGSPRFVLFASGFLDPGYRRFIERRLRETFGFEGTPTQISVRVREKRKRTGGKGGGKGKR